MTIAATKGFKFIYPGQIFALDSAFVKIQTLRSSKRGFLIYIMVYNSEIIKTIQLEKVLKVTLANAQYNPHTFCDKVIRLQRSGIDTIKYHT